MDTGLQPPNYTQIPNELLALMPVMSNTELRVCLAIARQTFGWHKKRDAISISQLERLTGLSRQGVVNGINQAIERGIVERCPALVTGRDSFAYRLIVNDVDQSTELTSQQGRPELVNDVAYGLVNDVDPQKKERKKEKERGVGSRDSDRASAPVPAPAEPPRPAQVEPSVPAPPDVAVQLYTTLTGLSPNTVQAALIAEQVNDLTAWRAVIIAWLESGYRPGNVRDLVDRYAKDTRPRASPYGGGLAPPPKVSDKPILDAYQQGVITAQQYSEWTQRFSRSDDKAGVLARFERDVIGIAGRAA